MDIKNLNETELLNLKKDIDMDIKNLNETELLNLKKDIDLQLEHIAKINRLKSKTSLSELTNDDEIYCINFNNDGIYKHDFVKIKIYENIVDDIWNFSTKHDTLPLGCSSSFHNDYMKKHYFLSMFTSSMFFFTLKPENWKNDLKLALDFQINLKKQYFDRDVQCLKNQVMNVISTDINF